MGRRARVSREEVLDAARDAFSERGYEGTTLAAIGGRVGLSPAALLRHAPSKEALFQEAMRPPVAVAESLPMEFLRHVPAEADPGPVLRRLAESFVPFFERRIGADLACYHYAFGGVPADPRLASLRRRGLNAVTEYLKR